MAATETENTQDVIEAVAWCRLGSSSGAQPTAAGFREAERLGLLKHHPTWHATARGEGALIAAGRLPGEPAPDTTHIHVLWARHAEGDACAPWAQFVAAFSDGLVDAWPGSYEKRRREAEDDYRDTVGHYGTVAEFFTTVEEIVRPALESGVS